MKKENKNKNIWIIMRINSGEKDIVRIFKQTL